MVPEAREPVKKAGSGCGPSTQCNALFAHGSVFQATGLASKAIREFEKVVELDSVATRPAPALLASAGSVH